MKLKKAAMFGLDARIALAIFGALSVISGAALYSAIEQAKVIALQTETEELIKAIEGYMLDTGQDVPAATLAKELRVSSVAGWNGPYVGFEPFTGAEDTHYKHSIYDRISLNHRTSNEDGYAICSTQPGKTCYYWVFYGIVPNNILNSIDLRVDGAADLTKGRVVSLNSGELLYRAIPTLKQY